jgi:uridine kinase
MFDSNHVQNDFIYQTGGSICLNSIATVIGYSFFNQSLIIYPYLLSFLLMHVDADIRLARRIRRDTVERGRDVISVLEQVFNHCVS